MKKNISFIGLGKLGLPLATNFAKNGHKVLAIDKNQRLIEFVNGREAPWYEIGLEANLYLSILSSVLKNPLSLNHSSSKFFFHLSPVQFTKSSFPANFRLNLRYLQAI